MNNRNKLKELGILLIIISLISAVILIPYITTHHTFILGWDMRTEYSSTFEGLRTVLRQALQERKLPCYAWNYFLGNNFYANKLFYFQDYYDWIFAIFTNWSYNKVIILQTYLKFLVAGSCFYIYAKYHHYSTKTIYLGSLMFTFSAYIMQVMQHPFFASFMVLVPLYFHGVDVYLKTGKIKFYIGMVFLMVITNFYLFYTLSLLTAFYYCFSYYRIHQSIKTIVQDTLKIIFGYFVGLLLSGFIFIPEVVSILSNHRVGESHVSLLYDSFIPYFSVILGFITPTSIFANRNDTFSYLFNYVSSENSLMPVFLWTSSFMTLLFPQIWKRYKTFRVEFLVLMLMSMIPIFNSFMHGFSGPSFRWLYYVSFLMIVYALPIIDSPNQIDKKLWKKSLFVMLGVILLPLILVMIENYHIHEILNSYILLLCTTIPFILLTYLFFNKKLYIMCLTVELMVVGYFTFYGNPNFKGQKTDYTYALTHVLGEKGELTSFLNQIDQNQKDFYRIYVDFDSVYWSYSNNLSFHYEFLPVTAYDSTYAYAIDDMKKLGKIDTYLPWVFDIKEDGLLNLLSVKYALVTDESQLPKGSDYTFVSNYHAIKVYRNNRYVNFGQTFNQVTTYENANLDSIITDDSKLIDLTNLKDQGSTFTSAYTSLNEAHGIIETKDKGFVVVSVPFDKGWKILVNGNTVNAYQVSGGLTGFYLNQGENKVDMYFIPQGLKIGLIFSLVGAVLLLLTCLLERKRNG